MKEPIGKDIPVAVLPYGHRPFRSRLDDRYRNMQRINL